VSPWRKLVAPVSSPARVLTAAGTPPLQNIPPGWPGSLR
jgi:hypothetical protein